MGCNSRSKVASVSDLLQRVAASCLSQRLPGSRTFDDEWSSGSGSGSEEAEKKRGSSSFSSLSAPAAAADSIARAIAREKKLEEEEEEEDEEEEKRLRMWEDDERQRQRQSPPNADADADADSDSLKQHSLHLQTLLSHVFDSLSALKRSYRSLQHAHCPWDPLRIHAADAALVSELRKLDTLRDRFRRSRTRPPPPPSPSPSPSLRDALAPYEAALADLHNDLKLKQAEIDHLRHKLHSYELLAVGGKPRQGRSHFSHSASARWTSKGLLAPGLHVPATPIPELFQVCMQHVQAATKSFSYHLLALMRAAHCDVPAAIQSLLPPASPSHLPSLPPKLALHSYVNSCLFHGFQHESFYMDGSLASLLDPAAFRKTCFSQFCDMRTMDPTEMLGVLPTCQFGRFATTKYLSLVSDKMEESLFAHTQQRQHVVAGTHPRTEFYAEFLRAAKAVWMLHLLAFALDPAPTHFEVRKGAEFQPEFMESAIRFPNGRVLPGSVVGFAIAPGFRLGNGSIIRARVYLIPRNPGQ